MSVMPNHYADGPEALVVSLAAKGDREAFAELVRRRQSWIRNLMRRCCNDPVLAEDLAQQIFLQAWRKLRQLQDASKFGPWLKRLAINLWLQHQRKLDVLVNTDSEEHVELTSSDKTSVAIDLDRALHTLTGDVRACIVLSYHERLSHAEIAELTGMQLGTVKSHIRRGSERLRHILAAYGEST
jgi:RNA polymerase sigma factor (sigma-70 family)